MIGHPDVGGETPQHSQAALAVGRLFWVPQHSQHARAAYAHDVQHAVTVANRERPRGAAARVAGRNMRGDLNRFTLFVVSSSRDLVGRALLQMKHECDA